MRLRWHSGANYKVRLCAVTEPKAVAALQPSNNCHCQKAQQQKINLILIQQAHDDGATF